MTSLTKFMEPNNELSFMSKRFIYEMVHKQLVFSMFINGRRYFFFKLNNQIFRLSEYNAVILVTAISYIITFGTRKLVSIIKKYYTKKKSKKFRSSLFKALKSLRAGYDDIPFYENEEDTLNLKIDSELTEKEKFLKQIISKCLKPKKIYQIVNYDLIFMVEKMMNLKGRKQLLIVSFEVFTLGLVVISKNAVKIVQQNPTEIGFTLMQFAKFYIITNLPIFAGVIIGVMSAFNLPLDISFYNAVVQLLKTLVLSRLSYEVTDPLRSFFFIDCLDYVRELPFVFVDLPNESRLDRIFYVPDKPARQYAYVTTHPDQKSLYFLQEQTLDGRWANLRNLRGERSLHWFPNNPSNSVSKKLVPLSQRTRTLQDIQNADTTRDRMSAMKIIAELYREKIEIESGPDFWYFE